MIIQETKSFMFYIFVVLIAIIAFFLIFNYPMPVVIRSVNNFIRNFSINDILNNNNFLMAVIFAFFGAVLLILFFVFTGNRRSDIFLSFLIIPIVPKRFNILQAGDTFNPFGFVNDLTLDFILPYFVIILFIFIMYRVVTFNNKNRRGIL